MSTNRAETVQQLASQLRRIEWGRGAPTVTERLSTGIEPLDRLLPERGLPPGTLIEWLSPGEGCGAGTLAFRVAEHVVRAERERQVNRPCVVVDADRSFYPLATPLSWQEGPSANGQERLIVIHPANDRDALWALEQSLRCPGVAVVVGWVNRLHAHAYRRLQLAAETGGAIGLLLRPGECRAQPSWADLRLWVEPLSPVAGNEHSPSSRTDAFTGRLLRIELIYCRGRAGGGVLELEIDDETGDVRLASQLAAATDSTEVAEQYNRQHDNRPHRRPARKSRA